MLKLSYEFFISVILLDSRISIWFFFFFFFYSFYLFILLLFSILRDIAIIPSFAYLKIVSVTSLGIFIMIALKSLPVEFNSGALSQALCFCCFPVYHYTSLSLCMSHN